LKLLIILPCLTISLLAPAQTPKSVVAGRHDTGRLLVVLDPGHGGDDDGAKGRKGLMEKDVALELATLLAAQLAETGLDARLTRSEDTFIPLWDRARMANEAGADLFISLHLNAAPARQARGSEVYFLSLGAGDPSTAHLAAQENAGGPPGTAAGQDDIVNGILNDLAQKAYLQESEQLAVAIQGQLNQLGGIRQRGVKQAPFVVLRGAAMPAVLVETAFISNPKEEAKLRDPKFLHRVAQAITRGVRRFFAHTATLVRRPTPAQAAAEAED
jgi:N-acetylmuramoyl-L-alanine amidase